MIPRAQSDPYFLLKELTQLADALRASPQGSRDAAAPARSLVQIPDIPDLIARRAGGASYGALAADLNRRGIRGRYGARWYPSSVWVLLHRSDVSGPARSSSSHCSP